jgi:hypothetical protein
VIDPSALQGLNWSWILLGLTAPMAAALLLAWPVWRSGQPILGNLVGTAVLFGSAVGLIMREQTELDRIVQACIEQGTTCWPAPAAFTRFAVYAFVALGQVILLFTLSVSVEDRHRRKRHAPQWR